MEVDCKAIDLINNWLHTYINIEKFIKVMHHIPVHMYICRCIFFYIFLQKMMCRSLLIFASNEKKVQTQNIMVPLILFICRF